MKDDVIRIINRSNQRGGRMLSLVDLIEADTLTLSQAAWVTERIETGASFLVGAVPGGAGKTAVMGALLAMLPAGERVLLSETKPAWFLPGGGGWGGRGRGGGGASEGDWRTAGSGDCLVAYEISPASYEAYIWGDELRSFVERGVAGARLVSNLHADSLAQAREQLVRDNGVSEAAFAVFDLFLPITVHGGLGPRSRVIEHIDYRTEAGWRRTGREPELSARGREIAEFLEACRAAGTRLIEDVRAEWLRR